MSFLLERRGEQRFVVYEKAIGVPGVLMFGAYNYLEAHPGLPVHQHPSAMEIVYLARGEQTYRVGGRSFQLRGGEQFLTFPDEWHDSGGSPEEKGLLFWIVLKAGRGFLGLPAAQGRALGEALARIPARQFKAHPEVEPLLREILEMLSASRDTLGQAALAATVLRYLFKTIEAASALDRPPVSAPVARVLTWIEANPEDPSPVETLAAVAGLSAARFKTRFKQEVGVPPREYVLRQKIKVARMLLGAGSVTDTAFQLGFSSSQYFARVFRRFTGESPTEFLRKNASAPRPG